MYFLSRKFTTVVLVCSLALAACQMNPITGRRQLMIVSDQQAEQQSSLAYQQVLSKASDSKNLNRDNREIKRVRRIANRLISTAGTLRPDTKKWKWEINILESKKVNAWCMAGGKIAVYSGMLDKIKPTDAELAAVMGHEISHALLSHQTEKMSRMVAQKGALQLGVLAGKVAGVNLGGVASVADIVGQIGLQLPNGRKVEYEADEVGMRIAAQSGYDPRASVSLWEKMAKKGGGSPPEWLSTHPSSANRIAFLRQLAEKMMPIYQRSR